jgi:ubiquinone/menaquinone biosynthesis C-methylase UbiE
MTQPAKADEPGGQRVCPAAHGGLLATSLRRLVHNPERILGSLIEPGETVADLGCGPGFFALPAARLVGAGGRVIAVDLQAEMLEQLRVRAARAGLEQRITLHQCTATEIGLAEHADFALAFYMVHEVPDAPAFLAQVHALLKPTGRFLLVEPWGHVSAAAFARTVAIAQAAGFVPLARPRVVFSRAVLLQVV